MVPEHAAWTRSGMASASAPSSTSVIRWVVMMLALQTEVG